MEQIRNKFGRMVYSVGSIIELDRLALSELVQGNRSPDSLTGFWTSFRRLTYALPRMLEGTPIEAFVTDGEDFSRFGPLDSHLLDCLRGDPELWLATTDDDLNRKAATISRGRVVDPRVAPSSGSF
jgi:hypothetical protein